MEKLHLITLIIHIAAGTVAFVAAPVALLVKKGATAHRSWGKVYFWAMTFIAISGIVLSLLLPNLFLFCVAFFAYFMVVSGYRWLYRKNQEQKVAALDWFINGIALLVNAGLVVIGIMRIMDNSHDAFGYISSVFGLLGLGFSRRNITQFLRPTQEKGAWLFHHIGGMMGGYIATVSAFSAVNMNFLPALIQWLWPTIIGVPVIYFLIAFYRSKMAGGKNVEDLVEIDTKG